MSGKFCNYINISNIQNVWFGYLLIDDVSFYINICLYYVLYTFNNLFYIFCSDVCIMALPDNQHI